MAGDTRRLEIQITGDPAQAQRMFQGIGKQAQTLGDRISDVGSKLTRTLTPAAAGAAVAFGQAAGQYNDGFTALRAGTGATGAQLDSLVSSMKDVSGQAFRGGVQMGEVGQVMADVNTNMGLTGDALEDMTSRFLELDRLGMATSIEGVNRAFGDWGVATEDQADVLDGLFRQAQFSGVSIDELAGKVVQFGAPLRNLGFTMDEATALMAKWGKEGVNTETIMGGLRQGIGRLAKEGKDVPTEFRRIVEEIENAGSSSDATAIAIEAFGQRAGPDLADAVRGGKFELEDFLEVMETGDTIEQAAKDTLTLTDRLRAMGQRFQTLIGPVGEVGALVAGFAASIGPALMGIGQLAPMLGRAGAAFKAFTLVLMTNPFVALAAALAAIATLIFFHRDKVLGALKAAWEAIAETASEIWGAILEFFEEWWPILLAVFTSGLSLIVQLIIDNWDAITETTEAAWDAIVDFFKKIPQRILDALGDLSNLLVDVGRKILRGLHTGAKAVWDDFVRPFYIGIPAAILSAIGDVARLLYDKGWDTVNGLWSGASAIWTQHVAPFFTGLPGNIVGALGDVVGLLWDKGYAILKSLVNGAAGNWLESAHGFFSGIPGDVVTAIGDLSETLKFAGGQLMSGLVSGAAGVWSGFWDWLTGLPEAIGRAVGSVVSAFKAPINTAIRGINAIEIPQFTIGWDAKKVFGKTVIPGAHLTLGPFDPFPYVAPLAEGTVARARNPILGLIGEGPDDEIVSPVPTMRDVIRSELDRRAPMMGGPVLNFYGVTDPGEISRLVGDEVAWQMRRL